jgi:hypothetical protein
MKNVIKLVFASTLALAAFASNFANAAYLENSQVPATGMASHVAGKHTRALDSMAYAPADFGGGYVRDFGISSQR